MTLREQLLAAHDNNPITAAASLAEMLMQDDPDTFKDGYTRANAELTAIEVFPEITGAKSWRFDLALDDLLETGQDGARRGSTAQGGGK